LLFFFSSCTFLKKYLWRTKISFATHNIPNRIYCCNIEDWKVSISNDPILVDTFVKEDSISQDWRMNRRNSDRRNNRKLRVLRKNTVARTILKTNAIKHCPSIERYLTSLRNIYEYLQTNATIASNLRHIPKRKIILLDHQNNYYIERLNILRQCLKMFLHSSIPVWTSYIIIMSV